MRKQCVCGEGRGESDACAERGGEGRVESNACAEREGENKWRNVVVIQLRGCAGIDSIINSARRMRH